MHNTFFEKIFYGSFHSSIISSVHPRIPNQFYSTMCLRSSDPFYIVSYYIKWVTTWTHSILSLYIHQQKWKRLRRRTASDLCLPLLPSILFHMVGIVLLLASLVFSRLRKAGAMVVTFAASSQHVAHL